MEVSGKLHVLARERAPGTHWIGGFPFSSAFQKQLNQSTIEILTFYFE